MKKDNNDRILKSSLSTLLKRFSSTDLISSLDKEFNESSGRTPLSLIDDNRILKKARINEKQLDKYVNTIREKGIAAPLLIIQNQDRYEVVYPRIVYVAARKLHLETVPTTILKMNEEEILVFLASNLRDRKGANIIELALVLNRLQKKYKYKQKDIAAMMKQSRSQITNIMRLTKMPDWLLREIANDNISFGHARTLIGLDESELLKIVPMIKEHNLSVRDLEKNIYEMKNASAFIEEENNLSQKLGCKVSITPRKITFTFASEEERELFVSKLNK